jgi:MFS family permease
VIPLMAAELFGVRVLGRVMGIVLTADGVAEAVAPVLVGRMHDVTGSYARGFATLIAFALAGAVAIGFLPRAGAPRPAASPESSPPDPLSLRERGNEPSPSSPLSASRRGGQGVRTRPERGTEGEDQLKAV